MKLADLYLQEQIEKVINEYKDRILDDQLIRHMKYDIEDIIDDLFSRHILKESRDSYYFDVKIHDGKLEVNFV